MTNIDKISLYQVAIIPNGFTKNFTNPKGTRCIQTPSYLMNEADLSFYPCHPPNCVQSETILGSLTSSKTDTPETEPKRISK